MPKFLTPLKVELVGDQSFKLTSPLVYQNSKYTITLFKEFVCDGLSKPAASWGLLGCPFGGIDTKAGFIHDALYRTQLFDRRMCDYIFYEALLSCDMPKIHARSMYYAVRAAGESSYLARIDVSGYRDLVMIEPT